MRFRVRLTIALFITLAVCAAMGQDPYAPQAGGWQGPPMQPPPGTSPPATSPPAANYRYPVPQAPAVNQAWRYPLPQGNSPPAPPARPYPAAQAPASQYQSSQNPNFQNPNFQNPPAQNRAVQAATAVRPQPLTNEEISFEPPSAQAVLFAPGQIVARVGDKSILYADVAPTVNIILGLALDKAKTDADRNAIEAQREVLTKGVVSQAVQNKMFFIEFERGMPSEIKTDVKKRSEMEGKQKKIVRNAFESSLSSAREKIATATQEEIDNYMRQDGVIVRLALLMKEKKLESYGELDAALRQYGTSLDQQIREYGEYIMGMEALREAVNGAKHGKGKGVKGPEKKEVTHQDILDYYQQHQAEYYIPAKARFEILTARFSRFGGDKNAARDYACQMGNQVIVGGTPFPAVARKFSQEPHASEGGYYDWVTPGGLASKPIDQAIFTIEVDKLSQIIEDDTGCHIVHVLERKNAGRVSFEEAQPNIRKAIENQRKTAEQQKFFANLKSRTKVWTIYDPVIDGAVQSAGGTRQ